MAGAIDYTTQYYGFKIPVFDGPFWGPLMRDMIISIDAILFASTGIANVRGLWLNATDYEVGDVAIEASSSDAYQCLVAHTSAAAPDTFSDDRTANPTYWQLITLSSNYYTKAQVDAALALKAALASPTFTGVPAAPTAAPGTNTTQIATTAFVKAAVDVLTSGAPAGLNTFVELATALGNDSNFSATMLAALALRLRFDASQSLSSGQKTQALTNLGFQRGLHAGDIIMSLDATAPTGCVELNGATISGGASTYPLVAARYAWMVSASNLILPDFRGRFIRSWAHGSANDPDRATRTARAGDAATGDNPGTYQADNIKSHNHGATLVNTSDVGSTYLAMTNAGFAGAVSTAAFGGNETRPINVNACFWMVMG